MQGCRWWNINTANGVYDWTVLDAKIAAYGSGPWTYCCFGTPTWASARPTESHPYGLGRGAEPANMQYLTDFVTALVNRYPTLTHVEVWNEPDLSLASNPTGWWFSGTVAAFVTLCQTVFNASHAANPSVKVIGPGTVNYLSSPNWLDAFFAAGGASYLDAISMHGYQMQWGTNHKALLGTMMQLRYMRNALSKAGITGKDLYISEFGQINPLPSTMTDEEMIAAYRRAMVVAAASGVKHANWYQYDDASFGYQGRVSVELAVTALTTLLNGSTLSAVSLNIPDMTVSATINGTQYTF